jgi:hypothetical protein
MPDSSLTWNNTTRLLRRRTLKLTCPAGAGSYEVPKTGGDAIRLPPEPLIR